MKKMIVRGAFTAAAAAAVFGFSAGTASADAAVSCPAQVPAAPTTGDYVNAWNTSGACLGGGAAGLVSSAWAGAIPTLLNGAFTGWYR
jgi:hypothetical protein